MADVICLEGQDGVGKTTQAAHLRAALESMGMKAYTFMAPGETKLGRKLRALLLNPSKGAEPEGYVSVALFEADMIDTYHKAIRPILGEKNTAIVLDRFWYSTLCYQCGFPNGVNWEHVKSRFSETVPYKPDYRILLDLPLEVSLKRCGKADAFERKPLDFHERVYANYQRVAEEERFQRVEVGSIDETHRRILTLLGY